MDTADRPDAAAGLRDQLLTHGVVVRDGASFGHPDAVRIAVPDADGLRRLELALTVTRPPLLLCDRGSIQYARWKGKAGTSIFNFLVNTLCPGPTDTAILQSFLEGPDGARIAEGLKRAIPMRRSPKSTARILLTSAEGPERLDLAREAFPPATWERLGEVKRRVDPDGVFRNDYTDTVLGPLQLPLMAQGHPISWVVALTMPLVGATNLWCWRGRADFAATSTYSSRRPLPLVSIWPMK